MLAAPVGFDFDGLGFGLVAGFVDGAELDALEVRGDANALGLVELLPLALAIDLVSNALGSGNTASFGRF